MKTYHSKSTLIDITDDDNREPETVENLNLLEVSANKNTRRFKFTNFVFQLGIKIYVSTNKFLTRTFHKNF